MNAFEAGASTPTALSSSSNNNSNTTTNNSSNSINTALSLSSTLSTPSSSAPTSVSPPNDSGTASSASTPAAPTPAAPAPTPSSSPLASFASGPNALGRLGAAAASVSGTGTALRGTATPPLPATAGTPVTPRSPVRFIATTDAFGLHQHHPSTPLQTALPHNQSSPTSSSSPGSTTTPGRRLRRPSLLSLAPTQATSAISDAERVISQDIDQLDGIHELDGLDDDQSVSPKTMSSALPTTTVHPQPTPWGGVSPVSPLTSISSSLGAPPRVDSAPPLSMEGLTTRTSPILGRRGSGGMAQSVPQQAMDTDEYSISSTSASNSNSNSAGAKQLNWAAELGRRRLSRTSGTFADDELPAARLPFSGRPLPGPLLATLISESSPLEHEMRSEARYQRLISSHPSVFPLTPRQRRNTRWTRGRFPEMVGDDDDDDEDVRQLGSRWLAGSSDSDSDDMMDDATGPEWQSSSMSGAAGAVNTAFASVMDLDRPASSGSSGAWASGKSTPGGGRNGSGGTAAGSAGGLGPSTSSAAVTPSQQWKSSRVAPSPGTGLQLPTAFGSLAMGGNATPLGSPTVEKMDLAASPSAMPTTPGMMQYREPTSGRPGKRKAGDDRFDPYKRPRGSSPSPFQSAALSPSKPTNIPIPSSPSHLPLVGSALAMGSPGYLSLGASGRPKTSHAHGHNHTHPYTRPMASRSRAASPALSIGSTSGVLSTSLGNGGLNGPSRPLAGPFIPTGPGAAAAVSAATAPGAAPSSLGGLGLLSLRAGQSQRDDEGKADDAMEED